eukprot:493639-Ditylum_brightwellii.AAC.1
MRPSTLQNSSKRRALERAGTTARASMSQTRTKCGGPNSSSNLVSSSYPNKDSLAKHFKDSKAKCGANSRLCEDLFDLKKHMSSVVTGGKHGKACRICGKTSYSMCTVCIDSLEY